MKKQQPEQPKTISTADYLFTVIFVFWCGVCLLGTALLDILQAWPK